MDTKALQEAIKALDIQPTTEGRKAYRDSVAELIRQWSSWLFTIYAPGDWTFSQFQVVYDLAWSTGHSNGYYEVESHLVNYIEYFQRFLDA